MLKQPLSKDEVVRRHPARPALRETAGGGSYIPNMVIQALSDFP
jgi:hypothetical protein